MNSWIGTVPKIILIHSLPKAMIEKYFKAGIRLMSNSQIRNKNPKAAVVDAENFVLKKIIIANKEVNCNEIIIIEPITLVNGKGSKNNSA